MFFLLFFITTPPFFSAYINLECPLSFSPLTLLTAVFSMKLFLAAVENLVIENSVCMQHVCARSVAGEPGQSCLTL